MPSLEEKILRRLMVIRTTDQEKLFQVAGLTDKIGWTIFPLSLPDFPPATPFSPTD